MNVTGGIVADIPSEYIGSILWVTVLSAITFVTISGNTLTILAISLSRQLSSMTANKFILSLAISDLLVGLYVPYHISFYLIESLPKMQFTCILRYIVPIFACTHSICKLLTIAADRYIAVVYPLHYNKFMTKKLVWSLILGGLFVALILSSVPIYWNDWDDEPDEDCNIVSVLPMVYFNFILTPLFGMAWIAMFLLYIKIWREAFRHAKRVRSTIMLMKNVPTRDTTKSFQVVMLTLGCFSICWMPYFIVTTYYRISDTSSKFSLLYEIAFTMAVGNSGMNPVIYAWKNSNFREAFRCLLTCRSPNDATKKTNYITNHVPSKKGSMMNGGSDVEAGGCQDNASSSVGGEVDVEMDSRTHHKPDYDEHECSVSTETTTVNTWT